MQELRPVFLERTQTSSFVPYEYITEASMGRHQFPLLSFCFWVMGFVGEVISRVLFQFSRIFDVGCVCFLFTLSL
jgi:hypothetical protein